MLIKVKSFLSSRRNLLALGTLIPIGGWIYSRIWMVNPAILGDEYLYSMNARKAAPWDPSPAGDFSNYLFNFVYQGTNLCGEAFYTCGKIFNLFFFLGFIFTLFIVAIRFMPFWAAYGFMIAAGLSPLSVYTSMFLPESMYMFFMGLLLISVLHAMRDFNWQNWAVVGVVIGLASLVKPHAWLSALAVGITLFVVGVGNRELRLKASVYAFSSMVLGAITGRLVVGLLVAGPKALGFFGQYLGLGTLQEIISGPAPGDLSNSTANSPIAGVFSLFLPQLMTHLLVNYSIMALAIIGVSIGVIELFRAKKLNEVTAIALFSFIWLFSLVIEIVIFTGWITGGGDDHTTRVLLRYYEFLFVIVPLAGLVVLVQKISRNVNLWIRWILAGMALFSMTPAFSGYFSTLTIQIADAPTLAGLVVNADIFNATAILGILSIIVFATFPKFSPIVLIFLLPVTMIGTGWQIQDQYQNFRAQESPADMAGKFIRDNYSSQEIDRLWILASTRFEATNAAIWADGMKITAYELVSPGSVVSSAMVPDGTSLVLALNQSSLDVPSNLVFESESFKIYRLNDD